MTLQSRSGEEAAVELQPGGTLSYPGPLRTFRPEPHYLPSPSFRYWFDFLPDSGTLYFKYN